MQLRLNIVEDFASGDKKQSQQQQPTELKFSPANTLLLLRASSTFEGRRRRRKKIGLFL